MAAFNPVGGSGSSGSSSNQPIPPKSSSLAYKSSSKVKKFIPSGVKFRFTKPSRSVSRGSIAKSHPDVVVATVKELLYPKHPSKAEKIFKRDMRMENSPEKVEELMKKNKVLASTQKVAPIEPPPVVSKEDRETAETVRNRAGDSTTLKGTIIFSINKLPMKGTFATSLQGAVGVAENIGRRIWDERSKTEDRHIAVQFLIEGVTGTLTGVFDGHGGHRCAHFVSRNLPGCLAKRLEEFKGSKAQLADIDIYNALKIALVDVDQLYATKKPKSIEGSTATIQLHINNKAFVANLGDSRTIRLYKDGKTVQESYDMKMEEFTENIESRGGTVGMIFGKKVVGDVAVPRAIGDSVFQGLSARCKITCESNPSDTYTIHVCDGITDVMTTEEIGAFVHNRLIQGDNLAQAAKALVEYAYYIGSVDNLSVQIIDNSKLGTIPSTEPSSSNVV